MKAKDKKGTLKKRNSRDGNITNLRTKLVVKRKTDKPGGPKLIYNLEEKYLEEGGRKV